MSVADQVRQGLIARGMAPHIADAFIWNFQDESGLNPGITEAVPNVHGTRGRGLYQLTGPRRTAYEAQYGDAYDIDSQLDWLMYELNGPEARAGARIMAAPDTGSAAAAIVTDFLRPAAQHRDRRVAAYTGGSPPAISDRPYDLSRPPSVFNQPPQGGQNALAGMSQQEQAMNALAMMQQFQPRHNALNAADFMVPQGQVQLMPIQGMS